MAAFVSLAGGSHNGPTQSADHHRTAVARARWRSQHSDAGRAATAMWFAIAAETGHLVTTNRQARRT